MSINGVVEASSGPPRLLFIPGRTEVIFTNVAAELSIWDDDVFPVRNQLVQDERGQPGGYSPCLSKYFSSSF